MENLVNIVREEVEKYAGNGEGGNLRLYLLHNETSDTFAVAAVDYPNRKYPASVVVMARVVGEIVIIEDDKTDKPLYKALIQRGIQREHIILAYDGELYPELT